MTAGAAGRDFFERIGEQGFDPRLGQARGTLRFDVTGTPAEHWYVALDRGAISVSGEEAEADVTVTSDAETLDGIVEGRLNATTATLRGLVHMDGDVDLLFYFQRLFPSPRRDGQKAATAAGGAR
jgi:ubiquinone biosynthesis protein UbiJ